MKHLNANVRLKEMFCPLGLSVKITIVLLAANLLFIENINAAAKNYNLQQLPPYSANITVTNPLCYGSLNGTAVVNVIGGTAPYTYLWSNGSTSNTITALGQGTYTVVVTDADNLQVTASTTITSPAMLNVYSSCYAHVSCYGGSDGVAMVAITGGTAPYTYLWNNGQTTANVPHLMAGTYTVTALDANGCSASASVLVTQPSPLHVSLSPVNGTCTSANSGSISSVVSGGTLPYSYSWSNGATSSNISGLPAGTYSLMVTDANHCNVSATAVVTTSGQLNLSLSAANVSCYGGNNGGITSTITGASGPYMYNWSNGAGSANLSNLTAGTYSLTVTSSSGCSATASVNVTEPQTALNLLLTPGNVSCYGGNDGSINTTVSGGTAPYSYVWSNAASTQNISQLSAGLYKVTVYDASGCSVTGSATLTQSSPISDFSFTTPAICDSSATGSAFIIAYGGTFPYTYHWNNGGSDIFESDLSPGVYYVTVTDANSCSMSVALTVEAGPEITLRTSVNSSACSYGSATVAPLGAPLLHYSYLWSNGDTTATASMLNAGTYTVTVTSFEGCTASASVTVGGSAPLIVTINSTAANCATNNGGSAMVTATGGSLPYHYLWSNGDTASSVTALFAGNYNVTVTDASGCSASSTVQIISTGSLALNTIIRNVACNGGSDGTIEVQVLNGSAPFSYLWSNGESDSVAINLVAGTYVVTVTDSIGCMNVDSVTIAQPAVLTALSSCYAHEMCFGDSSGVGMISVNGGTAPYTYLWSNGATTALDSNLTAGMFSVTVTDNNGCTASASIVVAEPAPLSITTADAPAFCNGMPTGSAMAMASGGTLPYSFLWSNGETSDEDTALIPGTYSVTVTDGNGCTASATVDVIALSTLNVLDLSTSPHCFGDSNAVAQVHVIGGFGPYSYLWGDGHTGSSDSGLTAGVYNLSVTDSMGCTARATINIAQATQCFVNITSTNVLCFGTATGSANATGSGGIPPYYFLWNNGDTAAMQTNLMAGTYSVILNDSSGCFAYDTTTITQPTPLTDIITSTNVACNGNATGSVSVSATGGVSPYTYLWENGLTTNSDSLLTAGTYYVTITDSNGCSITDSVIISEPLGLSATLVITNVACFGDSSGTAVITIAGGVAPYAYSWNTGSTADSISGLTSGAYFITVTDSLGCLFTDSFTINSPNQLVVSIQVSGIVACTDSATASAYAFAVGGFGDYTYLWNTGATTAFLSAINAGNYSVTVTDANGCTASASVTIALPMPPGLTIISTNPLCYGDSTGSAVLTITNGTAPYIISWSSGLVGDSILSLSAGTYFVSVTDSLGCIATDSVVIAQPSALLVSISGPANVACADSISGTVTALVTGGTGTYTYLWNSGDTTAAITHLVAGNYSVTVTDSNGCSTSGTITINPASGLVANIISTDVSCFGENNGSATVNVVGGTMPYRFAWSTGDSGATISGLQPGAYYVLVTDSNGCQATAADSITEPDLLTAVSSCYAHALCYGDSNGIGMISVRGGTEPYRYLWSNGSTYALDSGLVAGTYTVTVTDANGCTASATILVAQPAPLFVSIASFGSACTASSARATADGGTLPYFFEWSNGANGDSISGLVAGTYFVTVFDGNGCTATASITITQQAGPVATVSVVSGTCQSLGSVRVTVMGGIAPYHYNWNNGDTSAYITGLNAGNYYVTVTDANGCTATASAQVTQATTFTCSISTQPEWCWFSTGNNDIIYLGYGPQSTTLNAAATGTGPFTYSWTPAAGLSCTTCANPQFTPTATGMYTFTVTITNSSGCTSTCDITVCVMDVRVPSSRCWWGDQVYVCHYSNFCHSNGGYETIAVNALYAPIYLLCHPTDRIGWCNQQCGSAKDDDEAPAIVSANNGMDLLIYPNPFNSEFHLKIETDKTENANFKLFDLTGKLITEESNVAVNTEKEFGTGLAKGVYFVEVTQGGTIKSMRIIKTD